MAERLEDTAGEVVSGRETDLNQRNSEAMRKEEQCFSDI